MIEIMDNLTKAHKIVDEMIRLDYNGDLEAFLAENGSTDRIAHRIYSWLVDGNGHDMSIDECRLAYELWSYYG